MFLKPIPLSIIPTHPEETPGGSCSVPDCPRQAIFQVHYNSANPDPVQQPRTLLNSCQEHLEYFLNSKLTLTRLPDPETE